MDEIARRSAEFASQGGGRMSVTVVPLRRMKELIAEGEAGCEDAQRLTGVVVEWFETVKRAVGEGMEVPRCVACQEPVEPGDIEAVILLAPAEGDGVALAAPACDCCGGDYAAVRERFLAMVVAEYGGEIHKVQ